MVLIVSSIYANKFSSLLKLHSDCQWFLWSVLFCPLFIARFNAVSTSLVHQHGKLHWKKCSVGIFMILFSALCWITLHINNTFVVKFELWSPNKEWSRTWCHWLSVYLLYSIHDYITNMEFTYNQSCSSCIEDFILYIHFWLRLSTKLFSRTGKVHLIDIITPGWHDRLASV